MFYFYTQNGSFDSIRCILSITTVSLVNLMKVILNSNILQNVLLTMLFMNDGTNKKLSIIIINYTLKI